jgi:hypothetical protein
MTEAPAMTHPAGRIRGVTDRADLLALLAATQGSNDLEQLPPATPDVQALLDRWARGEATEQDLRAAEQQILAGQPVAPRAPRAA